MRSFRECNLRFIRFGCLMVTAGLGPLCAATVYNEFVQGDLSNSGLTPTLITVAAGSNQIFGTTGRGTTALDRDYFTVSVPVGLTLSAIDVLPGTQSGGVVSFIGLQAGTQVTIPTNATNATGLLGWWHYSPADISTDILPEMAIPATGSSGFAVPLGPGNYSFWVQDFNAGSFVYGFDLVLTAPTPEPGAAALMLTGSTMLALLARRRARKKEL